MSNYNYILLTIFAVLVGACDLAPLDEAELEAELEPYASLDPEDSDAAVGTVPADDEPLGFGDNGPSSVPIELVISDCPGAKRLIGVLSSGSDCTLGGTVPASWQGAPLFAAGSPRVAALANMPGYFGRYCAFDYVGELESIGSSDYDPMFAAIEASPDIDRDTVSADCRGEFSQGAGLYEASIGAELHQSFMTNIDWETGAQIASDPSARAAIEVAVLDTVSQAVADDPQLSPGDAHGLQISALVERISCPTGDPACEARVRNVLAMPREDWTTAPDWSAGGHHGTQGDLALAIYAAVHDWRARRLADPAHAPVRLVVNLSLGWDRVDSLSNQLSRGPASALVAAMNYVNCQGGVIIVSAGNVADESCPQDHTGPLDPAAFERLDAPSDLECADMGLLPDTLSQPVFGGAESYRPLVHAVGALDEQDRDLINMRPAAMPRLAALGANGIVDPGAESLAGTSVSAAIVSATAALVWSYRPDLRAPELMALIHDAGWSLGRDADFRNGVDAQSVHRVSVCAALDAACAGQGPSCPVPGCSATGPALDGHLSAVSDAVELVLASVDTLLEDYGGAIDEAISCASEDGNVEVNTNNLSSPQPEMPLCSRCNLSKPPGFVQGDDQLSMSIDPNFAGSIAEVQLITKNELGELSRQRMPQAVIDSLNAQPDTVDVTRVLVEAGDAVSAGLRFVLLDGSVQSNRIPVIEG